MVESAQDGPQNNESEWTLLRSLRELWKGFYIVNGGYDGPRGGGAIRSGHADAIAYGTYILADPDLPSAYSWLAVECTGSANILRRRRQGLHGLSSLS